MNLNQVIKDNTLALKGNHNSHTKNTYLPTVILNISLRSIIKKFKDGASRYSVYRNANVWCLTVLTQIIPDHLDNRKK